eukprot:EG_transcript_10131
MPRWWLVLAFRLGQACVVQTSFYPDEYWQSLEVAYQVVFGEGTLTWEWDARLRGWTHPLIFAALYRLLAALRLDYAMALILCPKLLQAVVCAVTDFCVFRLAERWFSGPVAHYALVASLTNWFNFFCGARTFANCMEACCTAAALTFYPLRPPVSTSNLLGLFFFAGFGVVLRQTNALVWIPCTVDLFLTHRTQAGRILLAGGIMATFWLLFSITVDSIFYGKPVFCMWEFFKFNALEGKSELFGTHPWHWYITQGWPAIMGTQVIALAASLRVPIGPLQRKPLLLAAYVVAVYSAFGHKEFRFIYPVLPLCLVYAGHGWWLLRHTCRPRIYQALALLLLVSNAGAAAYFSLVHQRATISVTHHLRNLPADEVGPAGNRHVDFLMGCHQTPGLAYFHRANLTLNWMDCAVRFDPQGRRLPTQHSVFLTHPRPWVDWVYAGRPSAAVPETEPRRPLPWRFVMYDTMAAKLQSELQGWGYTLET